MAKSILIIEDDKNIAELERDYLEANGYEVDTKLNGESGLEAALKQNYNLILLDLMLPGMDGFEICRCIRREKDIPILMVSAKKEDIDKIRGFGIGADDYIVKPFSPKILVARVNAILRRTLGNTAGDVIEAGDIKIDKAAHIVKINDKMIDLSYKEFELLSYFVENQGIALSREKILNNVWNYDYFGDARTIDTHVKKLRSKLGDRGEYIKTIWGMGYKFEVN